MSDIGNWRHVCVDMQRLFAEDTPWHVDWMEGVMPQVLEVSRRHAERTYFTRFIPPRNPQEAIGTWREYYTKWWMMTGEHLAAEMLDLVPELQPLAARAKIVNKRVYSPWIDTNLLRDLREQDVQSLVVTGGETDVCVLATVLGAVDLGFKVIVLGDAVCSGTDATHDAAINLLADRFSAQLDLVKTEDFLSQAG